MSFYVLDLFPDLLDIGLERNTEIRCREIACLREDRVRFTVHLLGKEIQLSADALLFLEFERDLLYMALQTYGLLIRADLVCVDDDCRR